MKFEQETSRNLVSAYDDALITLGNITYPLPIVLYNNEVIRSLTLPEYSQFDTAIAQKIISFKPEIVLLGTGKTLLFPKREVHHTFLEARVGLEVMATGAACRTYNILAGERRNMLAIFYPGSR